MSPISQPNSPSKATVCTLCGLHEVHQTARGARQHTPSSGTRTTFATRNSFSSIPACTSTIKDEPRTPCVDKQHEATSWAKRGRPTNSFINIAQFRQALRHTAMTQHRAWSFRLFGDLIWGKKGHIFGCYGVQSPH